MEQLAARWAHNPKVRGSSPLPATRIGYLNYEVTYFLVYQKMRQFSTQYSKELKLRDHYLSNSVKQSILYFPSVY